MRNIFILLYVILLKRIENLEENWIQKSLKIISNILSLRILDKTDGRNTKYNLSKTENQEPSLYPRNLEYCGH